MTRSQVIGASFLLDWVAGDPEWFPHPVRLMGRCIEVGEKACRRPGDGPSLTLIKGAALTFGLVGVSYACTAKLIQGTKRLNPASGMALEVLLGWTCLASRNLFDESRAVITALDCSDVSLARQRLARIVGRDTAALSETEIARAVIETLAESSCDGIVAPLFYMAIGGVPLAMGYKAVNTLDSMIGHADERYFYFGKVAARLDDVANYLPARLTAFAVAFAAGFNRDTDGGQALRTCRRDGAKHKSPNAGQPESAMAGALRVRLGGENTYAGECIVTPLIGAEFEDSGIEHARRALSLVTLVSVLSATAAVLLCTLASLKPVLQTKSQASIAEP